MCPRARSTASRSTPANTVTDRSGMVECCRASMAPGRALPAAQPQTEFTITSTVPESFFRTSSTCSGVVRGSTPTAASSCHMGFTASGS